eukprot:Pgem_evm1s15933
MLTNALQKLVDLELLVASSKRKCSYYFKQSIIKDYFYNLLTSEQRSIFHDKIAQVFECDDINAIHIPTYLYAWHSYKAK